MATSRAGWLWAGAFVRPVGAGAALAALGLGLRWASAGTTDVAAAEPVAALTGLLTLAAAVGCWLCYGWLMLAVAATVLASLPGRLGAMAGAVADRLTPVAARQALRLALGLAVAAGPAAVGAGAGVAHAAAPSARTATASPDVLPDLDRPAGQPALDRPAGEPVEERRAGARRDSSPVAAGRVVVVRPGDTLWGIAAERLGPAARDCDIAAEWPRWYAANRAEIGPDPDLLMPGQRLRRPG